MAHEKILVVDDSPSIRSFLIHFLTTAGYGVEEASDGNEALDIAARGEFDLVVSDINMPNCSGIDLLRGLNKQLEHPAVIMITGYGNIESAREALVEGAVDYILKPFKHNEILASVQRALEHSRASKENTRIKETRELFNVSEAITSKVGQDSVYETILMSALRQTHTSCGATIIIDEGEFQLKAAVDLQKQTAAQQSKWEQHLITHMLLGERKPVLVALNTNYLLPEEITQLEYTAGVYPEIFPFEKETIFFPLLSNEQLFGFSMFSKRLHESEFSPGDIQLLSIISSQTAIVAYNSKLLHNLENSYLNTLKSLNLILEAKHLYTQGHSQRVANLCMLIGGEVGLGEDELATLKNGALLHDIGKIGISELILDKQGPLTEEEFEAIRLHPVIGDEIVKPITFLAPVRPIIRHHHEWVNGRGWPDGLTREEISPQIAICAVADAVDAMSSDRSYRQPLALENIRRELITNAGTQFHPDIVEIALDFINPDGLSRIKDNPS